MRWAILDTDVYVGHWEAGLHRELLDSVRRAYIVRHSAVVLSELRRGARTREAAKVVADLHRLAREPWAPMASDWWEAGRLVRGLGDAHRWESNKRRAFQNDALIALTARRHGATLVTGNREDFALLARALRIPVVYARP